MSDKKVQRIMARDKPVPIISQQRARIAELEAALREIERADCWMMTGDAAVLRAASIARKALGKEPVNG